MAKRRAAPAETEPVITLAIPLPTEGIGSEAWWTDEIKVSEDRLKKELDNWKTNLARYRGGKGTLAGLSTPDVIAVVADYYNVEQKKSGLFFQTPDLIVTPRQTGLDQAAPVFQHILNEFVGPHELSMKLLMDDVIFDALVIGMAICKVGYDRITRQVPAPVDPAVAVDPLAPPAPPVMIPQTIWDQFYAERISPAHVLIPASYRSTRFDKAPWLGFRYTKPDDGTERRGRGSSAREDTFTLATQDDKDAARGDTRTGYEIWYQASTVDPAEMNPDRYRRLVIEDSGRDQKRVTVHENSPWQTFDAAGRWTGGMRGNPIGILTLRVECDTAYVKSDCAMARATTDELSAGRSQMVLQRRRNNATIGVDKTRAGKELISAIERGTVQSIILTDGDPNEIVKPIQQATFPRENFTFDEVGQRELGKIWAQGNNQQGVQAADGQTATEASLVDKAMETRAAGERARVLAWYLVAVDKIAALLQLFVDDQRVVAIVGADGAQQLQTWDKTTIQGRYAFSAKPDSAVRLNAAEDRELFLRFYNLAANDPAVNRGELVKVLVAKFGLDPAKLIAPPAPPVVEKPKISLSFKGEDLTNPLVLDVLQQCGIVISPDALQNAIAGQQAGLVAVPKPPTAPAIPPHGGAAQAVAPISKHDAALTGKPSGPRVQ